LLTGEGGKRGGGWRGKGTQKISFFRKSNKKNFETRDKETQKEKRNQKRKKNMQNLQNK
jgi:hypothetical protein